MLAYLGMGVADLLLLPVIVFVFLLPIIALIDVLKSRFDPVNKLVWVLVILFLNWIGALLYYYIGRKQKLVA